MNRSTEIQIKIQSVLKNKLIAIQNQHWDLRKIITIKHRLKILVQDYFSIIRQKVIKIPFIPFSAVP